MRITQNFIFLLLSILLLVGCTARTDSITSSPPTTETMMVEPTDSLTWDAIGNEGDALFPVKKDGLWGFIDKNNQVIIPPQFKEVQPFSQGFAAIQQEELWGFIDYTGNIVIAPVWQEVKPFRNQRAAVKAANGQWGYIDTTGELVIPYQFDIARNFRDQTAIVTVNEQYGLIDLNGNYLIDCRWATLSYCESRHFVSAMNNGGYQLFSVNGHALFDTPTQHAFMISDELYAAQKNGEYMIYHVDDKQPITQKTWSLLRPVSEHNVIAKVSGGYQLLTLDSAQITHTSDIWDSINFNKSYDEKIDAFIVDRAERYGVIDSSGQIVVSPQWDNIPFVCGGLALVQEKYSVGVISLVDENIILEPSFPLIKLQPNGYIVFKTDEGLGIMAADGTIISPPQWSNISTIGMNTFLVCTASNEPHYGVIDAKGNMLIEPQYSNVSFYYSFTDNGQTYQYICAQKDDQYHLIFVEKGEPPVGLYVRQEDIVEA